MLLDVLISGKAPDALGLESFFSEQAALRDTTANAAFRRSGQSVSYSPRLGLEGEPVPDRMQTRIGTYIEPSRFGGLSRQHFTFGFNVKLFPWSVFGLAGDTTWSIGGVADLAPRYQSFGLTLERGTSLVQLALVFLRRVAFEERGGDLALESRVISCSSRSVPPAKRSMLRW